MAVLNLRISNLILSNLSCRSAIFSLAETAIVGDLGLLLFVFVCFYRNTDLLLNVLTLTHRFHTGAIILSIMTVDNLKKVIVFAFLLQMI